MRATLRNPSGGYIDKRLVRGRPTAVTVAVRLAAEQERWGGGDRLTKH